MEPVYPLQGVAAHLLVLSVQGDTLQVCTNPAEGHTFSGVISATLTVSCRWRLKM
jgi:hypothetical protein